MGNSSSSPTSSSSSSSSSSLASAAAATSSSLEKDLRGLECIRLAFERSQKFVISSDYEKLYVEDLRRLVYDVEDAQEDMDHLKLLEKDQLNNDDRKRKRLDEDVSQLDKKIQGILKRYENMNSLHKSLNLPTVDLPSKPGRTPSGGSITQKEIYSMEKWKKILVEFLIDSRELEKHLDEGFEDGKNNLTIIPIHGGAGTGKTTFVQHVYNHEDIKKHFQRRGWVCASNGKDHDRISMTNSVLGCIFEDTQRYTQLSIAQQRLTDELETAGKILLVIDDVSNTDTDLWSTFWIPFVYSAAEGSVVLITTRNFWVIDAMPSHIRRTEICPLPPLPSEDCWSLFQSRVGSEILENAELAKIGREIASKYQGFPSAIIDAASKLKHRDEQVWREYSYDLKLDSSYHALSVQAKRCFLYCAVFPRGHSFSKDHLIRLWISQGFIEQVRKLRLDDIAGKYVLDLLYRSFLCHREDSDEYYQMPNPVHEFAQSILISYFHRLNDRECPVDAGREKEGRTLDREVRHISYIVQASPDEKIEFRSRELLRTFLVINDTHRVVHLKWPEKNAFDNMLYLRTLDLSHTDIVGLPESIGDLRSLRYLCLNSTPIQVLPDELCNLRFLQTLELNPCRRLRRLPRDFGNLLSLEHLVLDTRSTHFSMPPGFSRLTNLQTLSVYKVGSKQNGYAGIEELEKLDKLRGEIRIKSLFNVRIQDAVKAKLEAKRFLRDLTLCWSSPRDGISKSQEDGCSDSQEIVFDSLKPHTNILYLQVESYPGTEFPQWIGDASFKKLKFLKLNNCMDCVQLPSLGALPSLKNLVINCEKVERIDDRFQGQSNAFTSLEKLLFEEMMQWQEWSGVDKEGFPRLRKLQLLTCPLLTRLPEISTLKTLKMIKCRSVTDIPSFPNLLKLNMIECSLVTKIPDLPELQRLEMDSCDEVTQIPSFPLLKILKVNNCKQLSAIGSLPSPEELEMENCDEVSLGLPSFPHLTTLKIGIFKQLKEISRAESPRLRVNCKKLKAFFPERKEKNCHPDLPSLKQLEIQNCKKMEEISFHPWEEKSEMDPLEKKSEMDNSDRENHIPLLLPSLTHLEILTCNDLVGIHCLRSLPKLEALNVFSCPNLRTIHGFSSLEMLKIENCDGLSELPTLQSLTSLTLMYCQQLKTISMQPKLETLWVETCSQLRRDQVLQEMVKRLESLKRPESLFVANCHGITCKNIATHPRDLLYK